MPPHTPYQLAAKLSYEDTTGKGLAFIVLFGGVADFRLLEDGSVLLNLYSFEQEDPALEPNLIPQSIAMSYEQFETLTTRIVVEKKLGLVSNMSPKDILSLLSES